MSSEAELRLLFDEYRGTFRSQPFAVLRQRCLLSSLLSEFADNDEQFHSGDRLVETEVVTHKVFVLRLIDAAG